MTQTTAKTAVHGCHCCHCSSDIAVRMPKILTRPWIGIRVCHLLLLFCLLFVFVFLPLLDQFSMQHLCNSFRCFLKNPKQTDHQYFKHDISFKFNVGYTRGHLHNRVKGHKQQSSAIAKHYKDMHGTMPQGLLKRFEVLK